jgi:hypothetical protein
MDCAYLCTKARTFETFDGFDRGKQALQERGHIFRLQTFGTFDRLNRHRKPFADTPGLQVCQVDIRRFAWASAAFGRLPGCRLARWDRRRGAILRARGAKDQVADGQREQTDREGQGADAHDGLHGGLLSRNFQ